MKTPIRYCRLSPAVLIGLAIVVNGCGQDPSVRLSVYGNVSYADGQTFNGSISFLPSAGKGPAATAGVRNGYYCFDETNGPTAGPHRVILLKITGRKPPPKMIRPKKPPAAPQDSPAEGGTTTWTALADVRRNGPYHYDFRLERN